MSNNCGWATRDKAIAALSDLLPTEEETHEITKWWPHEPTSRLLANERMVVALVKDDYDYNDIVPYLIAERSFLASCSSCWGYGLKRYPNCKVDWHLANNIEPGGQCDPFEEWSIDELRDGLQRVHKRIETGRPQPAGHFCFVVLDIYAAYGGGWQITDGFWDRLAKFDKNISSFKFNQPGYEIISKHDDHAVMIMPAEPDRHDHYLLGGLQDLHKEVGICLGLSEGQLYYHTHDSIYSDAINRLWLEMRNMPYGGVFKDGGGGHRLAKRIGINGSMLDNAKSDERKT